MCARRHSCYLCCLLIIICRLLTTDNKQQATNGFMLSVFSDEHFMRQALKDRPRAMLDVPPGMVEVRIDKTRATPTRSTGDNTMVEWIREEYELMILGPEPVRYASDRQAPTGASAPRVMDELF